MIMCTSRARLVMSMRDGASLTGPMTEVELKFRHETKLKLLFIIFHMHFKHYKYSYSALFYIPKAITQLLACVLGD